MQIDFGKIIKDSGQKLSKAQLARDMVQEGIFKTVPSAIGMIVYHESGKAKSCDYLLLQYLMKRFNLTSCQILNNKQKIY